MDLLQYYIFFIFIFAIYGITKEQTEIQLKTKTVRVQYLFWVIFALWILIGMRNMMYGRDTMGYVDNFQQVSKKTSFDFFSSTEPFFRLLEFLVSRITDNYHIFLMVCSCSSCVAYYYFMKRYLNTSYEILAGICIYVLLGLLAFNMAALRQTIALSIAIFAFMAADDGNWKKFLLLVGVAYLFHNSSFVLLCLFPLRYLNLKKWGPIIVAFFFILGLVAPGLVVPFLQSHMPIEERFSNYGTIYESSLNYTGFFLQLILVMIAYVRRNKIPLPKKTQNLFFNSAYIGLSIQSLTGTLAELYRLSFYFCVYDIILIPLALSSFNNIQYKNAIKVLFIIGCLIYIFILSGGGVLPRMETIKYI